MQLEKANMPACPKCGCNATMMVDAGSRFGRTWAKFGCTFCGKSFVIGTSPEELPDGRPVENGVAYNPVHCRCPGCHADNPPVIHTRGKVRFHRCRNCDKRFKSVEGHSRG